MMHFSLGNPILLSAGDATATVAPGGARVLRFDIGGRPILRPTSAEAERSGMPYRFAAFPLLPYSGPIFSGGFRFGGAFHRLARNVPMEPDVTHGDAWLLPWTVDSADATHCRLSLDYAPRLDGFPFAWHGRIAYSLEPDALVVEMSIENRDTRPMPAGMGLHPYFPADSGTRLEFAHAGVWPPDSADAVRIPPRPVPGIDFNRGAALADLVLDRCFEGWPGEATLACADGTTTISATPAFGKLQLYRPYHDPYVCIEPVSNANDGFNRAFWQVAGHGVQVLAPGDRLGGSIRIAYRQFGQ